MQKSFPQPLIGICGVRDMDDYTQLVQRAPMVLAGTDRFIMGGVKDAASPLFITDPTPNVKLFVHCDFKADESYAHTLDRTMQQAGQWASGIQMNVLPWMETDYAPLWRRLKQRYPNTLLMLQAHHQTMQYTPQQIAARLQGLDVDYIFFDSSQSRGMAYDIIEMSAYVDAIYDAQLPQSVIVAGGLCGEVLPSVYLPLIQRHSEVSCDGFSRMQDTATARISWPLFDAYTTNWRNCMSEAAQTMNVPATPSI